MRYAIITILALLTLVVSGCEKSSDPVDVVPFPQSAQLMGLTRDHSMQYIVYDSVVTYYPYFDVVYDTSDLIVDIEHGLGSQYRVSFNGSPHDVLTVDGRGILHSGQIRPQAIPQDTLFYVPTPIIMPSPLQAGVPWTVSTPRVQIGSAEERQSMLFFNYGYFTERRFIEVTNIVLPTSSYTAYHFEAMLFLDNMAVDDTLMVVDEYYAADIGLVQLDARTDASRRLIILLEDN